MDELLVTLLSGALAALIEVIVHRLADRYWPASAAAA